MVPEAPSFSTGNDQTGCPNDRIDEMKENQWYAWMNRLEENWRDRISQTQAEYRSNEHPE